MSGYLRPLGRHTERLIAVSIPDSQATLSAQQTADFARGEGFNAIEADSVLTAVRTIVADNPQARILICGSLYLAGHVLQTNG